MGAKTTGGARAELLFARRRRTSHTYPPKWSRHRRCFAMELRRISLPGTRVNKGKKEGRDIAPQPSLSTSSLGLSWSVCVLPDAYYLLDLLDQRLLLLLGPPPVVLLLPVAGFLLHQPALGHRARLFLEVAVVLARVAHRQSPPSFPATFAMSISKRLPTGMGS